MQFFSDSLLYVYAGLDLKIQIVLAITFPLSFVVSIASISYFLYKTVSESIIGSGKYRMECELVKLRRTELEMGSINRKDFV